MERHEYLSNIFSDNALIIVGRRIQKSADDPNVRLNIHGDNFELIKLSKEQYMYRLRSVFEKNEFINIQFEDNVVKKRDNQSNVYGINIKQNYYSSNYADQGYLFLLVDIEEGRDAKIYVRAWQPEKFDDGSTIDLSSFTY